MIIQTISIFPEMFESVLGLSMMWKAQDRNLVTFEHINLRDFGLGPRKQVDDTPYGGGAGMVFRVEPLFEAIKSARERDPSAKVILMTPKGEKLNQGLAWQLSKEVMVLSLSALAMRGMTNE